MRILLILVVCGLAVAEPPRPFRHHHQLSRQMQPPSEGPPSTFYGTSYLPPSEYLPPNEYLPPTEYGPPSEYGPPQPGYEYGPPTQTQTITKSIFFHLPPRNLEEEDDASAPPPNFETRTPQKHYKIVFIKSPDQKPPKAPEIPQQPQDEHKTLVYVLVKKPEPAAPAEPPPPTTTEASKPEVYFIKYKENNKPDNSYLPPR